MTENTPAPLATSRTRQHVPAHDAALRALLDAATRALAADVDLDAAALRLIMAARGHSLPGRDDYRLADDIAALIRQEPTR